jgi:hypothetical protein
VLLKRLCSVMNSIVASTESAFLKGRQLLDGVLVINEIVDLAKKSGCECLILWSIFRLYAWEVWFL